MAKTKTIGFAVAFWNDDISIWYTWDDECEGAICGPASIADPVAMFSTRAEARKAIDVTKAFARLLKAQGRIPNDDFLRPESLRCIHIVPLAVKGSA